MKLLVIGGSYFYGRVFVMEAAKEHEITVWNRGTYSMADFGVRQITGDRHEKTAACEEDWDAVIDFCAYASGDIRNTIENITGKIGQYVLISTVDVYERNPAVVKTEDTPLEERSFAGETGAYIAGKVALEREITAVCKEREIPYTVLRPAILYGPYNYAPRESAYIQMLLQNHALPRFTDADGRFQVIYVKDAAQAILNCLGKEKAYGQAYNLCQDEIVTYESFFETLKQAAQPEDLEGLAEVPLTVEQAVSQGVPVPFPATAAETHLCDNAKGKAELGLTDTDFAEGMRRTYRAFRGVFVQSEIKENGGRMQMTLDEIAIGKECRITSVGGEGELRLRLLDMGLIPKTVVRVQKVAPMGDPIEIHLRGYELTIRKEDAAQIEVTQL